MFFNKHFLNRAAAADPARTVYEKIVAQARQPVFYLEGGIEDNVDGRFDMIILHAILLICRLNEEDSGAARDLSQRIFDELLKDMDRSLREMGVGDLSVGKKIKKMAQVFYGRAKAYDNGIRTYEETPEQLVSAVRRNLFPEGDDIDQAGRFARYMLDSMVCLRSQDMSALAIGDFEFAGMEAFNG